MPYTVEDSVGTEINYRKNSVSFANYINRKGRMQFEETVDSAAGTTDTLDFISGGAIDFISGGDIDLVATTAAGSAALSIGADVYVKSGNILTYTSDFNNAAWTATNASVSTNQIVGPFGSVKTDLLIEDNTPATQHYLSRTAATIGAEQTLSVYVKAKERTEIAFQLGSAAVYYNLSTGAITQTGSDTADEAWIDNTYSNEGWYRCVAYVDNCESTSSSIFLAVNGAAVYNGDGASGLYLLGAQLVTGYDPGTYIESDAVQEVLWGGTVDRIVETDITVGATTTRSFKYTCVDFDEMATRRLVAASYAAQTASAIVSDLITTWLPGEGITAGTVKGESFNVTKAVWNYVPVSQALDDLAEMTGYVWQITPLDKKLHFYDRTNLYAPWLISDTNQPYLNFQIEQSRTNYRNTQYVRGGYESTDNQTEDFEGDGTVRSFAVSYPVDSIVTIKIDGGAAETTGVLGIDTGKQWYYQVGSNIITHDSGETVLDSANDLEIIYKGRFPIIVKAEDSAEVATRSAAESGSGTYEAIVNRPEIDVDDLATDIAFGIIERHSPIPTAISFQTDQSGLEVGQLLNINLTAHGINDDYLIESVSVKDRGDNELRWSVRALSGQAFGSWVKFFKDLQRAGNTFTIRANEVLILLSTVKDTMSVQDSPSTATSLSNGTTVGAADAYCGLIDCG